MEQRLDVWGGLDPEVIGGRNHGRQPGTGSHQCIRVVCSFQDPAPDIRRQMGVNKTITWNRRLTDRGGYGLLSNSSPIKGARGQAAGRYYSSGSLH